MTTLSLSDLPGTLESFAESHHAAMAIGAQKPVSRSIRKAHSNGVTAFLSKVLHRPMPDPIYARSVVYTPATHAEIQAWRRINPDGFLMNRRSANSGMLHRAECDHFGSHKWTARSDQGLASQQKICSLNLGELKDWAKRNGLRALSVCEQCKPAEIRDLVRSVAMEEDPSEFEPESLADARQRVLRSIIQRQGQPAFRTMLLRAYSSRCAFSGCEVTDVLEAAHICPYQGPETNHPQNGLLLRTDLHTLFDLGLLAVDTETMTIVTSGHLDNSDYAELSGRDVRIPKEPAKMPSTIALDQHRKKAGL